MSKLDNIPKKNIYKIPEDYFDKLSGVIQSRITEEKNTTWSPILIYSFRYVLPVVVVLLGVFLWITPSSPQKQNAESILTSIETEELILYLAEDGISRYELFGSPETPEESTPILDSVAFEDETLDAILEEYEFDYL